MNSKAVNNHIDTLDDLKQVLVLLDKVLVGNDLKLHKLERKDLEAVRQIVSSVRRRIKSAEH